MSSVVVCHRVDRATRVMRWVRRLGAAFLLALAGLTVGGVAAAYWTGGGVGIGFAATGSVSSPTAVSATVGVGSDMVSISWGAASLSTGDAVVGYYVTRTPDGGGTSSAACGTSTTTLTAELSCQDTAVADGTYRYVVTAVVGSWTAPSDPSAPVTVLRNVDPPSVSASTSPAPNANGYNKVSPVNVVLTASDPNGVTSITYRVDSGGSVTVPGGSATVSVSGEGTHTVTYSAVDTVGNRSAEGTHVVRIDTVAPARPMAPYISAASDTGISSTDGITRDQTPTFEGMAEPGSTVDIFATQYGSSPIGSVPVGLDGTYSATPTFLVPAGSYTVYVRAVDSAGNVSQNSPLTSITIDVSAATPSPPTLDPSSDTGRSSTDGRTSDTTPTFTGSVASDAVDVRLYRATGVQVGSATTPSYNITATVLTNATHSMTVQYTDRAGNVSASSAVKSVTVDTSAPAQPTAPALAPGNDTGASSTDRITNNPTPTLIGTTEASAEVKLFAGTMEVGTQITSSTAYSVRASALADGTHVLKVTATDVAGNVSPASGETQITVDTIAPTAPSAPVLDPSSDSGTVGDRITNDTTPTFTGTAPSGTTVTLFDGSSATGTPVVAVNGTYTATTGTLADGVHDITARTDPDTAGNVGISATTTVTIDTTAPATPMAPTLVEGSDSGRSSSDLITNDTTPTFYDSGSNGVVGVRLYDGGVEVARATAAPSYLVTTPELDDGTHMIAVRVLDRAGNLSVSSAVRTVVIDTKAPEAPTAPEVTESSDTGASSSDGVTNDATPTVVGENETSAHVVVYADGALSGAQTTSSGKHSVTLARLAQGDHVVTATATDIAGNLSPVSSATRITIDTTAPAAPSAPVLIAASDTGVSSNDRITNDSTPAFTGSVSGSRHVTVFDGHRPVGRATVASDGTWTATISRLRDGQRTITARTEPDLAGNIGISPAVEVTVDTVAPAVDGRLLSKAPVRYRFRFSQEVRSSTAAGMFFAGTTKVTRSGRSGFRSFDVTIRGRSRGAAVVVKLRAGAVEDAAGNGNPAFSSTIKVGNHDDAGRRGDGSPFSPPANDLSEPPAVTAGSGT